MIWTLVFLNHDNHANHANHGSDIKWWKTAAAR
jgi:hypothetical protein